MTPPDFIGESQVGTALDKDHFAVFEQAIGNILASEIAQLTFTQLIDGCPLFDVVYELDHYLGTT